MNLQAFREIVDRTPAEIAAIRNKSREMYAYVGLPFHGGYQLSAVCDALSDGINSAFKAGHKSVDNLCRRLVTDLIREHVILGAPLEPYYELLNCLRDAVRQTDSGGEIEGDWEAAIKAARDHVEMSSRPVWKLRTFHAREYNVAESARMLAQAGYAIRLEPDFIALEAEAEASLVDEIEGLVAAIGGINVAQAIFRFITPTYDPTMERYHIVPSTSLMGGGQRQMPIGYLLQLAAKHLKPLAPPDKHEARWKRLVDLATSYASIMDVQPYSPAIYGTMEAGALLDYFSQQAMYDSMFRFQQLRASDVLKICRGSLSFLEPAAVQPAGWTLGQAYEVIGFLTGPQYDTRGPVVVNEHDARMALPLIPSEVLKSILKDVFSHPIEGPNRRFSFPTDAPIPGERSTGVDFYQKPLIQLSGHRYLILDRSMCGWGYLEALLTALRVSESNLDTKVGVAVETFVEQQLMAHGVEVFSGDYDDAGKHGECDIAIPTPEVLFFLELKKKPLTRRARVGNQSELLLDLGGSLLDALVQAGWHERRITNAGSLKLVRNGQAHRLSLDGRQIEKIALGMLDFGSFQDRVVLKQFLEATLNINFGSPESANDAKFKKVNAALGEIREQCRIAHPGKFELDQPFFNCWFMSLPQLLIVLDEVSDAATFKSALWNCRHTVTGTSDLYFEISRMRNLKRGV